MKSLNESFNDDSFINLCNNPHNAAPTNLSHFTRLSKTLNQINFQTEKLEKSPSNDDLTGQKTLFTKAQQQRLNLERKSLLAKTMVDSNIFKVEANNFFNKDQSLTPQTPKNGNYLEINGNSFDNSRRVSQFVGDNKKSRKSHFIKEEVNVFKILEDKQKNKSIKRMENFLESSIFQFLITILIVYALFGSDIKIMCFEKNDDINFNILTIISLTIFFMEIVLSILVKKNYVFSFFFWLDLVSTMTLFLDLSWVDEALFAGDASQFSQASKSTKIGSRAGRIIRIVRLFRLIRIIKIWKSFKISLAKLDQKIKKISPIIFRSMSPVLKLSIPNPHTPLSVVSLNNFSLKTGELEAKFEYEESLGSDIRVGKKLSELTTKRVSFLVLLLIFVVPLFDSNYFFDKDKSYTIGLKQLVKESEIIPLNLTHLMDVYLDYVSSQSSLEVPLIFLYLPSLNITFRCSLNVDDLRFDEHEELDLNSNLYDENFRAIVDVRFQTKMNSLLNILRTIFISVVLGFGAYFFTKDANDLALKPIARMIEKVNKIASNPLATKDQHLILGSSNDGMETVAIENAIIKIGTLLALGFGDAGSEIIGKNISHGGDMDPMLPGIKQYAIFGFCDIRNFTDTTEVLQEDVMLFVNRIAYIVHKTVDKFMGIANKNIGDAFLLLWKFENDDIEVLPNQEFTIKRTIQTKNIADFSLISFLKIICNINTKEEVLQYRNIKVLSDRIPNYKVKMGFGLHVGWAIEGAIGSFYKIDASYLSPNVNIASRLEAATKQYGVPLLISHELYERFSKRVQRFCREIDRVTVKGSMKPLGLFTVDVDLSVLEAKINKNYTKEEIKNKHKEKKNKIIEQFFTNDERNTFKASVFFELNKSLVKITNNAFGASRNVFAQGFENYISGKWDLCRKFLEEHLTGNQDDGPSLTLLNFIKNHNYQAPEGWPGYRELIDK